MKSKTYYIILFIGIAIIVGFYVYDRAFNKAQAPVVESKQNQQLLEARPSVKVPEQSRIEPKDASKQTPLGVKKENTHFSTETDIDGVDVMVHEINYNGISFEPATLDIRAGDIVIFKNLGSEDFRPASDPHPSHTAYPGFDAKEGLPKGKTFQFKFVKQGIWGFHDHLNPSAKGTIRVAQ